MRSPPALARVPFPRPPHPRTGCSRRSPGPPPAAAAPANPLQTADVLLEVAELQSPIGQFGRQLVALRLQHVPPPMRILVLLLQLFADLRPLRRRSRSRARRLWLASTRACCTSEISRTISTPMVQTSTARNGNSDILTAGLRNLRRLMQHDLDLHVCSTQPGPGRTPVRSPASSASGWPRKGSSRFLQSAGAGQGPQVVVECLFELDDLAGGLSTCDMISP